MKKEEAINLLAEALDIACENIPDKKVEKFEEMERYIKNNLN